MLLRAVSFSVISFSPFYKQRPFRVKDPRLGYYLSLPRGTAQPLHSSSPFASAAMPDTCLLYTSDAADDPRVV